MMCVSLTSTEKISQKFVSGNFYLVDDEAAPIITSTFFLSVEISCSLIACFYCA